jgi:hypothetical protein
VAHPCLTHFKKLVRDPEPMRRVSPLCPGISDLDLFGNGEGVIHFDPEVSEDTFDLAMTEPTWPPFGHSQ